MAGLSLAYYLSQSEVLRDKTILILEKEQKNKNDRTWCFWERGEQNPFEKIVYRKWQKLDFFADGFSKRYVLKDYLYKMIRGIDFYEFVLAHLRDHTNIHRKQHEVEQISTTDQGAVVTTTGGVFTARYAFDSTFRPDFQKPGSHFLLQHFKGWVITVPKPQFDTSCAILHDFRIAQQGDEARFFYLLPFSPTQALIEYTLFSPGLLDEQQYNAELHAYIREKLQLHDYTIDEEEFGVIPMSDAAVSQQASSRVIRIGTAGGYVRPSTGYTFARTQRYLQQIVKNLESQTPVLSDPSLFSKRFQFYDSVMLNVLTKKRYPGSDFFTQLYRDNPIERIFDFLDEKTRLPDELKLMSTVPWWPFTKAAADVIFRNRSRIS